MSKFAFIDESGDECVDVSTKDVSKFYVVCAVIIESDQMSDAVKAFNAAKATFFKTSEMKSASVKDDNRRQRIIAGLTSAPFSINVLVANKARMNSIGMRYPKNFIKNLHKTLYQQVTKDPGQIHLVSDEIKNRSFMEEMETYLDKRLGLVDLFNQNPFCFKKSKDEICLQAADFIGGTIRNCFESNERNAMSDPLIQQLKHHLVDLMPFPEDYCHYFCKMAGGEAHDHEIEARSILDAQEFVRQKCDSDDVNDLMQVAILRRLLLANTRTDRDEWVSTDKLQGIASDVKGETICVQSLRALIGKLRDSKLLIASRPAWGYKIAVTYKEVYDSLVRQNSIVGPMLERIRTCRGSVKTATNNMVDVLAEPAFQNLKAAIEAVPLWTDGILSTPEAVEEIIDTIPEKGEQWLFPDLMSTNNLSSAKSA